MCRLSLLRKELLVNGLLTRTRPLTKITTLLSVPVSQFYAVLPFFFIASCLFPAIFSEIGSPARKYFTSSQWVSRLAS